MGLWPVGADHLCGQTHADPGMSLAHSQTHV